MYTMPVSRFPYHQVANLLCYKETRYVFNKIDNPKNKWIRKIHDDIFLKINNTDSNIHYRNMIYTLKTETMNKSVYKNMSSALVYDFLIYCYINTVNPNTYGDWILNDKIIYKENLSGLNLSYTIKNVYVKYEKDIIISRMKRDNVFSRYIFTNKTNINNENNIFYISDPDKNESINIHSIEREKRLYEFLIEQKTKVYKTPDRILKSFFIYNKQFNIYEHIRALEYMTKTSIILVYNNCNTYVFDRNNYYINPRYKKIALVFITVKARITSTQTYDNILDKLRNLDNRTNKTWTHDEWFIKPSPSLYISETIIAYIKKHNKQLYYDIVDHYTKYGLRDKMKNDNQYMESLLRIKNVCVSMEYIKNGNYTTLHAILSEMAKHYIRPKNNIVQIKMSYKWKLKVDKNHIMYDLTTDIDDNMTKLVEDYLQRFKIADDTPKDIGFIDKNGYITRWIHNNIMYETDGFSTHASCKRIIRDIYLFKINRPVVGHSNMNKYIINKHYVSHLIPMLDDPNITHIDSQAFQVPINIKNMTHNAIKRAYQINGMKINDNFEPKYDIIPNAL